MSVIKMNSIRHRAAIDAYGKLSAQIAELEAQKNALKAHFADWDEGAYEGDLFRITVSKYDQENLNMDAVRGKLSRQFIAANTTVTPVTRISAKARTAEGIVGQTHIGKLAGAVA